MTINLKDSSFDDYNTHVFEATLPRVPKAEVWNFEKTKEANHLQHLFDQAKQNKDNKKLCSEYIKQYQQELDTLQNTGKREFTLVKGHVYELIEDPEHHLVDVPIKIQIKEGVLTWYFKAPFDQTKQRFRDEVFLSAGLAQVGVDHACFRYLRGTNSLHVKKMHTKEEESLLNHNHYVLDKGYDFTPERFKQHLDGFVRAEQELAKAGLIKDLPADGKEKFLTQEEADFLVREYTRHWEKINHSHPGKSSELAEKKELGQRRMTREDKHEWVKYNTEFNTVIASGFEKTAEGKVVPSSEKEAKLESETYLRQKAHFTINPNWPLDKRISAVKAAMRGGFSNRAQVRQIAGSQLPELPEPPVTNDAVKIDSALKKSNLTLS